ncbi:hypothetical protein Pse7367_3832 (plasmid) [Thalassoporum mexicanum PCC 7367]|uniref:hypothetical protein n=1 Tax=Thalassoporum mexicanum TaxID=3457544 RepID=UPI00029F808F|nr:hypothetical protein [Pseudanabaena sp. PCC 7367]AFY72055.1 hypothetical protein Pse7367_3832 [Pseudanabaena sp. PCC 7367]
MNQLRKTHQHQSNIANLRQLSRSQLLAKITLRHLELGKNKDLARLFQATEAQISNWSRKADASYMDRSLRHATALGLPKPIAVAGLDARRAHMQQVQQYQAELTAILDLLFALETTATLETGDTPYAS